MPKRTASSKNASCAQSSEIVVDIDDDNSLVAVIHWFGGKHTQHHIKRRQKAQGKNDGQPELLQIISHLKATSRDQDIARILNLLQIKTESGHTWRTNRVQEYRQKHGIAAFDAMIMPMDN